MLIAYVPCPFGYETVRGVGRDITRGAEAVDRVIWRHMRALVGRGSPRRGECAKASSEECRGEPRPTCLPTTSVSRTQLLSHLNELR